MSNRTLTYISKIIMLRLQFLIDRTRQLDAAINERAREFVGKSRWLSKLERRLDVFMLGTFAIAMGLDYAVTRLHCEHPSLEANPLARYLMELYGIPIGLGLTAIVSFIIVLSLSYGVYRFSNWHMSRVNLEFPVLRKLGTYSILLIAAVKGVNGAFSWLQYSCPSGCTMTFDTCACLPDSDGWQTSTIRDNGTVAHCPLGSVFVGPAEQVDGGVRIRFTDSLRKHTECGIVAMGSDGRIHVGERTCKFLPGTAKRIRATTVVFSGLQLEEIERFRFRRRRLNHKPSARSSNHLLGMAAHDRFLAASEFADFRPGWFSSAFTLRKHLAKNQDFRVANEYPQQNVVYLE